MHATRTRKCRNTTRQISVCGTKFKLMGGNLIPTRLVEREKDNDIHLDEDKANSIVESKLMGILMLEDTNDKKVGEYKRSLANSMSEGYN